MLQRVVLWIMILGHVHIDYVFKIKRSFWVLILI